MRIAYGIDNSSTTVIYVYCVRRYELPKNTKFMKKVCRTKHGRRIRTKNIPGALGNLTIETGSLTTNRHLNYRMQRAERRYMPCSLVICHVNESLARQSGRYEVRRPTGAATLVPQRCEPAHSCPTSTQPQTIPGESPHSGTRHSVDER